jgi:hypothetical protein
VRFNFFSSGLYCRTSEASRSAHAADGADFTLVVRTARSSLRQSYCQKDPERDGPPSRSGCDLVSFDRKRAAAQCVLIQARASR